MLADIFRLKRRGIRREVELHRRLRSGLALEVLEERALLSVAPNSLLTAAGPGGGPHVRVRDGATLAETAGLMAYDVRFSGGVHVATGDINGDGTPDIITGTGPGGGPHVRVFSGVDNSELRSFFAYNGAFTGGVFVAAGDVNGDGRADIITGAGPGGGPHVRVFSGVDNTELPGFFAYNAAFSGGVAVAAGDVDGDGRAEIITGAGPGGGPHVRVFRGLDNTELRGFFAYNAAFGGGVAVAAGDTDGDGRAEIITGAGPGGGPHVRVFSGVDNTELRGFFAYSPAFAGGVSVGAGDLNGDGRADVITGAGPGGGPHVRAFSVASFSELASFFAYGAGFTGGVFVGGYATTRDTLPPTITAALTNDTGTGAADGVTSDATIGGMVADSVGVAAFRAGFDATPTAGFVNTLGDLQANGTFTFSLARLNQINGAPLTDGVHTLHLQATDPAGNVSGIKDVTFTLDRQAPQATAALTNDTGVSATDGLTFDATVAGTVTESMGIGSLLAGFDATPLAGYVDVKQDVAVNGAFTLTPARLNQVNGSTLSDGLHTLHLIARDVAGNVSNQINLLFTLDTTLPAAPVFDLDQSSDSAPLGDQQTTQDLVTLRGTTEKGAQVLQVQSSKATVADVLGTFTFDSFVLAAGANALNVEARDAAGNVSSASRTITFSTSSPAVIFGDPDLAAAVKAALQLPATHTLTRDDLAQLVELSADSNIVSSLTGLEWAVNLQSLVLMPGNYAATGSLSDLSPLSGLNQLTSLTLVDAGLSSAELNTLDSASVKTLDLRYNDLTNLDALADIASLATVDTYGNPLTDVTALAGRPIDVDLQPDGLAKADTIPEIAASLHNLPLQLLEYVTNNIEYVAYPGSMKGAQATLETKAGNDWDQASLLIDLLAAAGVNARYVRGRVQVTYETAEQWLGALTPEAALTVMVNAGFNETPLPGLVEFDHVWVEAQLDVPGAGATWVAMDPSWKFKDRQPGIQGMLSLVPFDRSGFLSQVQVKRGFEYYEQQVAGYLQANMPDKSVADVPFDGPIIPQHFDAAPTTLPYTVSGATTSMTTAPANLEQRAVLKLKQGATELLSQTLIVPDVSLSRITVAFTAAAGGFRTPQLLVDGQIIASGTAVSDASLVDLEVSSLEPGDNAVDHTWTSSLRAGDYMAVGLEVNQFSHRSLIRQLAVVNQAAIDAINGAPVTPDEQIGAVLALAISKFFFEYELGNTVLDGLAGYRTAYTGMEFGTTTSQSQVDFFPDLQIPFVPRATAVDIPGGLNSSVSINNDHTHDDELFRVNGLSASSQENALWEELLNIPSISTARSLQLANDLGIPVFTINSSNKGTLLPQLTLPQGDIDLISDSVDNGAVVTTPRDITPLNNWSGVGYIIDSGNSVGYLISGGLNASQSRVLHGGFATDDPGDKPPVEDGSFCNLFNVGNPVNIANGNQSLDQTDISLPGIGLPLGFSRHYDAQSTNDRGLGAGWLHTYSNFLTFNLDQSITWTNQEGHRHVFVPDGLGGFAGEQELAGSFTATAPGFEFRYNDGTIYRFDDDGKFIELRDRYGNSLTLAYDGLGQLATVTDTDAPTRQLTFAFSGGHIASISDFTGRTWTYSYSGSRLTQVAGPSDATASAAVWNFDYYTDTARAGLLRRVTQPDGGFYDLTYFANGRVFQETDPEGFALTFSHNFFREETTVVDQRGNPTIYGYDDQGELIRMLHPDRTQETYVWQNGLKTAQVDAFGQATTYEYDALSNVTKVTDRAGIVTQFTYDPIFSNVTSVTRPGGRVTVFTYDAQGNLTEVVDAVGNHTTYTYDTLGQRLTETTPRGNQTAAPGDFTTTFTYNNAGQILSRSTDLPSSELFSYDARGNILAYTDANNNTTQFAYDVRDNLIRVTDPLLKIASMAYDTMDNLTSTTDELGRAAEFTYDLLERPIRIVQPDGTQIVYAYDAAGNRVAGQDELGRLNVSLFDSRNRSIHTIYPDGASTQMSYDADNRVVQVTDERGNATRMSYDAAARLIRSEDALGGVDTTTYDLVGNIATRTDRRGAVTTYMYDLLDRVTQVRGPAGFVTTTDYDANSNVAVKTRYDVTGLVSIPADPRTLPANLHRPTQYQYDVLDRRTASIDPLGQSMLWSYDAGGRVTHSTDELGRVTQFAYDGRNRMTSLTDALGGIVTSTYDAVGNRLTVTDQNNHTTSYAYDVRDRLTAITDAASGVNSMSYDAVGNTVAMTDELGRITRYGYDARDRQTSVIDALGGSQNYVYDAAGNVTRLTDELGRQTNFAYDVLNRRESMTAADTGHTAYAYDPEGNVLSINDPLGHTTAFAYDLRGRSISMTDAKAGVAAMAYDALDNLASTTDELNRQTTYQYDRLNRLTRITPPLGNAIDYEYDAVGNRTAAVDGLGHRSEYVYDGLDRRTQAIDANGDATLYAYDGVGNLTRLTDPVGNRTNLAYDALNRLVTETNELGAARSYQYDAVGNRISETDRNGRPRQFRFDALNRITQERWLGASGSPVNVISYGYDAADQLLAARDGTSAYQYTFDAVGRTLSSQNKFGSGTTDVLFTYTYDTAGNQSSRSDQIGATLNSQNLYTYDELDRMVRATQNVGGTINKRVDMAYDAASQMIGVSRFADAAGVQAVAASAYSYDLNGRLAQLQHTRGATTLAKYNYTFDNANRITQIVSAADGTSTFNYDLRDQLTGADHSFQTDEAYTYDDNGNRTNPGYSTATNNRLSSDGAFNYQYDAEGNRTRATNIATSEVTTYAWDHRNRLTQVAVQDSSGQLTRLVNYTYDLFDRRITKIVDLDGASSAAAAVERFVYDGQHIAFAFNGAGDIAHRYLHGPQVDQILADEDALGDILWPLADHQGTVRDLINTAGLVVNHLKYDSFGRITGESNAAVDFLFGYTGRERDTETGLHYYRARYYDPANGRFLSEDPIGFAAGDANLNRYVGNGPVNAVDPLGLAGRPKIDPDDAIYFDPAVSGPSQESVHFHTPGGVMSADQLEGMGKHDRGGYISYYKTQSRLLKDAYARPGALHGQTDPQQMIDQIKALDEATRRLEAQQAEAARLLELRARPTAKTPGLNSSEPIPPNGEGTRPGGTGNIKRGSSGTGGKIFGVIGVVANVPTAMYIIKEISPHKVRVKQETVVFDDDPQGPYLMIKKQPWIVTHYQKQYVDDVTKDLIGEPIDMPRSWGITKEEEVKRHYGYEDFNWWDLEWKWIPGDQEGCNDSKSLQMHPDPWFGDDRS